MAKVEQENEGKSFSHLGHISDVIENKYCKCSNKSFCVTWHTHNFPHFFVNCIQCSALYQVYDSKAPIKTLKKKKGSFKKLNNYRGILIIPILSIISEKLLKNRITPTLQQHMSNFQNGGSKGKGVVDNLFILRVLFHHATYLNKELWLTFYETEKCFDSLWLEDCINSLWENGVKDDTLFLIYYLNKKPNVVKTPFGETDPLSFMNIVKHGTVFGPVLNNVSLDRA